MLVTILPPFTREPSLIGELALIDSAPDWRGEVKAMLLGDSQYVVEKTDGYVILKEGEYAPQ